MRLRNTSQYPTERVRELVEFAMKGVDTTGVLVNVKNNQKGAVAGYAYNGVPRMSPGYSMSSVKRLVTLRIGPPMRFPENNLWHSDRKTKWSARIPSEEFQALGGRQMPPPGEGWQIDTTHWSDGTIQYRWRKTERHPYGGKNSPLIEYADWEEGLVALAAHEARHVYQHRHHKKGKGEVDAEKFAAKRLAAFRAQREPIRKAAR